MGLTSKMILPLFGAVLLFGFVLGFDDVNSLPPEEKRRIIRELLRAQKDIRRALLKVHYSLNGEEFEGDEDEDRFWNGCWDKELSGFRQGLEEKMNTLSSGLKMANGLMDEIDERIKPNHHHGHYESGYGGPGYGGPSDGGYGGPSDGGYGGPYGEYGHHGYGPGYGRPEPTRPPLTTTPETTSWRPSTESYETIDEDEYYARNRPVGGNRRYGRELNVESVDGQSEPAAKVDNVEQPEIEGEVAKALDALFDDKE